MPQDPSARERIMASGTWHRKPIKNPFNFKTICLGVSVVCPKSHGCSMLQLQVDSSFLYSGRTKDDESLTQLLQVEGLSRPWRLPRLWN